MQQLKTNKVLVSGASVAGLSTAYWMNKLGYKVTVVEMANGPRTTGAAFNIKGTALDAAKRMGIFEQLSAVVDSYRDGRLLLFIEKNALPLPGRKRRILGGAMVAPGAGELIQELILANASGLGISEIFDKVYPYPVAARINQKLIVEHQEVSPLLPRSSRGRRPAPTSAPRR